MLVVGRGSCRTRRDRSRSCQSSHDRTAVLVGERTVPSAVPVRRCGFRSGQKCSTACRDRSKVPAGTARRAAGYLDAFSDWNFISSICAYVCPASSSPLRRRGGSASPFDFFLLFLLADGGGDVGPASNAAPRKRGTRLHQ